MIIREYQSAVVESALPLLRDGKRIVVVLPTGAGKTVVASEIVRRFARPTLWLAHRRELIAQARAALPPGVVVDAVQRRKAFPPTDLIVVDEGHHAVAGSYLAHLGAHRGAVLHLTATPYRLDGKGIGEVAESALWVDWASAPEVRVGRDGLLTMTSALVRERVLVDPRYYSLPGPSVAGVKIRAGDYEAAGMMSAFDKPTVAGDAVREYQTRCAGTRAVAFCITVEHAEHVAAAFVAAGVRAAVVSGKTPKPERDRMLAELRAGALDVIATVMVLTEGWDLPTLETLIVLRPTRSLCLWLQMLGRVMRVADGKPGATVLDHAGNCDALGLATDPVYFDLDGRASRPGGAPKKTCPECFAIVLSSARVCPECAHVFGDDADAEPKDVKAGIGGAETLVEVAARAAPKTYRHDEGLWARLSSRMPMKTARAIYAKECGGKWPIISADGRLLDPQSLEGRKRFMFELLMTAHTKGFKAGWASHMYQTEYGQWPPREWGEKFAAWMETQS